VITFFEISLVLLLLIGSSLSTKPKSLGPLQTQLVILFDLLVLSMSRTLVIYDVCRLI
jgi:hypothetical protein